jgi:hypothetical protein
MSKSEILESLIVIESKSRSMGMQMRKEAAVARQELADRQRKGLTGDAAIAHYNEWMQQYGMEHLMVKEVES